MKLLTQILLILTFAFCVDATQHNPADCGYVACSTAVALAVTGDTINIPAGECIWSNAAAISWTNKNLHIIGAGSANTKITLTTKGFVSARASNPNYGDVEICGINLHINCETDIFAIGINSGEYYGDIINDRFLIHDMVFTAEQIGHPTIYITGIWYGIIYNCSFLQRMGAVTFTPRVFGEDGSTNDLMMGNKAWSYPLSLGSDSAVYIEDCIFDYPTAGGYVYDGQMGARVVIRHNIINGTYVITHACRGRYRGALSTEIYKNTFIGEGHLRPAHIRSGTGVIFENEISGYINNAFIIDDQRTCGAESGDWLTRACNGGDERDGNIEGEYGWPCLDQIGRAAPGDNGGDEGSFPFASWSNGPNKDGTVLLKLNGDFDSCLTIPEASLSAHIKTTGDIPTHDGGVIDYINNGTTPIAGYIEYEYPHPGRDDADLPTPVLDTIYNSIIRQADNWQAFRLYDTINIEGVNFGDSGATSAIYINSIGSILADLVSWTATKVRGIIPYGTPRGYYRARVRRNNGILTANPTKNNMKVIIGSRP